MTTTPVHIDSKPHTAGQQRLDKVRMAVVGCGAVAQQFHLPVLAGHPKVEIAALVDPNQSLAQQLARDYAVSLVEEDASRLTVDAVDAAILATPPWHHADCAVALAERGIHVLIEKPLAISRAEAQRVVEAAETNQVVATVGLFRRLFPSSDLVRSALQRGALGNPIGFSVEAGSVYAWPLASLGNMLKSQAGGGVLIDIGTHVIDHLLYVFDASGEVLSYRDNSLGGIETDCHLELRLHSGGSAIDGHVLLSRTRKLRGTIRIECEYGTLEVRTTEPYRVRVTPREIQLPDPVTNAARPFELEGQWKEAGGQVGYEQFRVEIDDFVAAICQGTEPRLDVRTALPTVELIDACYARREPLAEPWVDEGLEPSSETPEPEVRLRNQTQRVLLTGATGFLGCRVAELLQLRQGYQVRALVHNPGNAARLARLPVEMKLGDLRSPEQLKEALRGCQAVVHCAIGTAYGQSRKIRDVTVEGTRQLAEAARLAGVERFVHISSIAVHGYQVEGEINDTTPATPQKRDLYSQTKAAAERAVVQQVHAGLQAVILRPANIYGPYCPNLIARPLSFLRRRELLIAGDPARWSNTIYVDNVAEAICRALEASSSGAVGKAIPLGQDDNWGWDSFFGYFADALGGELGSVSLEEYRRLRPPAKHGPLRWLASWPAAMWTILASQEFKSLGRRILDTRPIGTGPRYLLENVPWFRRSIERVLGVGGATVYRREEHGDAARKPMIMNPISARVCNASAQRLLGYEPLVSRQRAMHLTAAWAQQSGLIG